MKINSGKYKGKKLLSPDNYDIRPTSDKARSGIFDVICHGLLEKLNISKKLSLKGLNVLDIFAGTGAFGLESISRGADFVVFIEKDKHAVKIIEKNIKSINSYEQTEIFNQDATKLNLKSHKFDLVFLDPPYNKNLVIPALEAVFEKDLLKKKSLVIVETQKNEQIETPDKLRLVKEKKYGKALFRFYEYLG
jgi:16S rRNA (guanine966-N2)-methyltransferase